MHRKLLFVAVSVVLGTMVFGFLEYGRIARGDGSFQISLHIARRPPDGTRVSYVLTQRRFIPLYRDEDLPAELDQTFQSIAAGPGNTIRIRVPFSSHTTGLLGREYRYFQPDEVILVRFESEHGGRSFATAELPARDQARQVIMQVPDPPSDSTADPGDTSLIPLPPD